jgi:hypothetical protein
VQTLLEPADEQQRVVGAGTEHEHGEDALALPVHGERARLGHQVDDCLGEDEREARRYQHGQEDRAAVDQQQDDEDDADRREQQVRVDALEGSSEVGELPARSRHVAGQAVNFRRRRDVLDDSRQRLERGVVPRQRDDDLDRLAVLAADRLRRRAGDALDVAHA